MPINVKISLCKITRASKLFQRNYYLPLLKPLSPKDALRRKIITGQNVLGNRIEHYIPVLKPHDEKLAEKKRVNATKTPVVKKKLKRKEGVRYVEPFLDENMDNHPLLQSILSRKPKGKGQRYIYEITDKKCNLVITSQMEKAIKDKDIVDITIAQRSEKIVVKLSNGLKIMVPIAPYEGSATMYRGSGWTKEQVEQEHHHGKETMSIAKLFEAKESGVEEWELEMMRMANKRKKKCKGEDSADWKQMLQGCVEDMDWDKFEEDTKQIVEEKGETVEEEDIPMAVDDMEKTKNVNAKLMAGGPNVLEQLPIMVEIPQVIKNLETGEMDEILNVSGARVSIPSGKSCFVPGQMVKSDENEVFVPGQTVEHEDGSEEYVPGITVVMDNEVTLIPGLVMGEEESNQAPMFLPGESTITSNGQLKFEAHDEDLPPARRRRELTPSPPPPPRKPRVVQEEEIVIKRRVFDEEPVVKERVKKRPPVIEMKPLSPPREIFRPQRQPLEDPLKAFEEQRRLREEEEKKRMKERAEEKILKEESKINQIRIQMRKKAKDFKIEKPGPYEPLDPIKKSAKLEEYEKSIKKGTFFDDDKTKEILEKAKSATRMLKYQAVLNNNNFGRRF